MANIIRNAVRSLFGPRSVNSIVRDANGLVTELRANAKQSSARSTRLYAVASRYSQEADRANRIAVRVENLLS